MAMKSDAPTFSIYIPKSKMEQQPLERLSKLSKQRDRSINYLVVEAILEYLDHEERREARTKEPLVSIDEDEGTLGAGPKKQKESGESKQKKDD